MSREFKYYPEDFGKLPVKTIHMDLTFDIFEDHTLVSNDFRLKALQEITELRLDAKNLEIQGCYLYTDLDKKQKQPLPFKYEKENNKLILNFFKTIPNGVEFIIRTETTCKPTKNILEGLYYDETPPHYPLTQITQCQQWGFQRLVPCFDDMRAKCTYTTTLIADSCYSNFLSNGDPALECIDLHGNPKPIHLGQGRSKMIYHNHTTPMAPYLFFLGVGTYVTFTETCMYPDGNAFRLELLTPLGTDPKVAEQSIEITRQAILWIYTYCGYQYTGKIYREIGMQNSDIGGMENVGNTTIITNVIMPTPFMDDTAYEYMLRVKVHEFYHNLNGSEVTGMDPFQIWLNEAVTVHVEHEYWAELFGESYVRIQNVLMLYAPMTGIFDQDNSPTIMPIIPKGFNSANELITSVTYVKAPEFIRMIELLIGKDNFKKGLALYYQRFKHGNATSSDWIQAMEEVSGMSLQKMADGWLKRAKYPTLFVKTSYDQGSYTLELEQKGGDEPWQFPFCLALVDAQGKDIPGTSQMYWMKKMKEKITFAVKEKPVYVSLNRGHSLYGKIQPFLTTEQLALQALTDSDVVNRYMAFQELLEQEKVRLLNDLSCEVNPMFIQLFGKVLQDSSLDLGVKGFMLRVADMIRDDTQSHKYQEIYDATKKIKQSLAKAYKTELLALYHKLGTSPVYRSELKHEVVTIKNRRLKVTCLDLLSTLETPEMYELLQNQFQAPNYPDRYAALRFYLRTTASDRMEVARKFKTQFAEHNVSWESYLSIVGSMEGKDVIELIQETSKDPRYKVEQAGPQRALYMTYSMNRKLSILTPQGLEFLTQSILEIGKLNEMTVFRMLSVFNQLDQLDATYQVPIVQSLIRILEAFPPEESASIHNTVKRLLKGSSKAIKAYEGKMGKKLDLL
ncbi:MAG: M1 family metallopeptidase [Nanoarchaeota archaeon]